MICEGACGLCAERNRQVGRSKACKPIPRLTFGLYWGPVEKTTLTWPLRLARWVGQIMPSGEMNFSILGATLNGGNETRLGSPGHNHKGEAR
jgi:hypothetical protein